MFTYIYIWFWFIVKCKFHIPRDNIIDMSFSNVPTNNICMFLFIFDSLLNLNFLYINRWFCDFHCLFISHCIFEYFFFRFCFFCMVFVFLLLSVVFFWVFSFISFFGLYIYIYIYLQREIEWFLVILLGIANSLLLCYISGYHMCIFCLFNGNCIFIFYYIYSCFSF